MLLDARFGVTYCNIHCKYNGAIFKGKMASPLSPGFWLREGYLIRFNNQEHDVGVILFAMDSARFHAH